MNCRPETFTLKKEHLLLLANSNIYHAESCFGAACIDSKRPYGNSNVISDIGEILGRGQGPFSDEEKAELTQLHEETTWALEVILRCQTFDLGVYENSAGSFSEPDWKKVKES